MLVLEIAAGIVLGWLVISALRGLGHFINKHRLAAQAIFLFGIALGGFVYSVLRALVWASSPQGSNAIHAGVAWLKLHPYWQFASWAALFLFVFVLVTLDSPEDIERLKRIGRWLLRRPESD